MTKFADYARATNAAYDLLLKLQINKLPIDLDLVVNKLSYVRLKTYGAISARLGIPFEEVMKIAENKHGLLLKEALNNKHRYIIAYNEAKEEETKRFTIAHELGHIVLEHEVDDKISEQEANCFTRNFLCPIPISIEKRLFTCFDYVDTYNISPIAADVSVAFRYTDFKNITMDNYFNICSLFGVGQNDDIEEEIDRIMGLKLPAEFYGGGF